MTDPGRPPLAPSAPSSRLDRRIGGVVRRARFIGLFEELWRRAVPIAWVIGLWVALAWLGLWTALPPWPRALGILVFVVALLAVVARALRDRAGLARACDRGAAIRRVEAESRLAAHEIDGLVDRLPDGAGAATARLWAVHRDRLAARVDRLATGVPHPDLGRRDRWALRPLLGFLLFIGWFAASGEHLERLITPFSGATPVGIDDRVDAWIDPPAYTGRPPLVLATEGPVSGPPITVPQGSKLIVRVASGEPGRAPRPIRVTLAGADGRPVEVTANAPAAEGAPRGEAVGPVEHSAVLDGDREVTVSRAGGATVTRQITVIPDLPPTIRLLGPPEIQASGAIKLDHQTGDDWGVVAAEARFTPPAAAKGRPLYAPPTFPLSLPVGRAHTGKGQTIRDVTAHPHAGAAMRLVLVARDEKDQVGSSEAADVVLPQRPFRKPLARALVELRRRLALDAGEIGTVVTALDALTLAPERFPEKPAVHLGLRFLAGQAMAARDDGSLRDVVDLLWAAATSIEDGDLAEHEKGLRDAQEALRKALADGAPPEEIARLTRELRAAMEKYLAAKAEQARRNPNRQSERSGPQRTITSRDLQRMLDRIEDLAKTGSREAAEELLRQLQEMMANLQAGPPSGGGESGGGAEALEKLGEMIQRQQKLMEETHRSSRGAEGEGSDGDGSGGAGEMGRLGEGQRALRDALRQFSEEMKRGGEGGAGPGGEAGEDGSEEFGSAGEAMGEAGEALGHGEGETALDAQTRALDELRRGARKLADQMMKRNGRGGEGNQAGGEDPLGRPQRNGRGLSSGGVKVPDEIDVERARRILEDIRRRLAEPSRPKFERDYLDRLLKLD